jgi:hypothetical protein
MTFSAALPALPAAAPVGFQCPPGQNHIMCQCCIQPMPDRRDEQDIYQYCKSCVSVNDLCLYDEQID